MGGETTESDAMLNKSMVVVVGGNENLEGRGDWTIVLKWLSGILASAKKQKD